MKLIQVAGKRKCSYKKNKCYWVKFGWINPVVQKEQLLCVNKDVLPEDVGGIFLTGKLRRLKKCEELSPEGVFVGGKR